MSSLLKRRFVVSSVLATAAFACTAVEGLHTVDFISHLTEASTTRFVDSLLSSRFGATMLSVVIAVLCAVCFALWRRLRNAAEQKSRLIHSARKIVEEREEIRRVRVTRTITDDE